jgi:hypothetical protein
MSCMGVHFALAPEDVAALRRVDGGAERVELVMNDIEERYLAEPLSWAAESDVAWDAIHRALAGGGLTWHGGAYPLNHAILGGESMYEGDDYILSLKTPEQVRDIYAALTDLSEEEFRSRYYSVDAKTYASTLDDEDLAYTWRWF